MNIFKHWMMQMDKQKKICNGCRFLCYEIEQVCPRCNAYSFSEISKEDEDKISIEDKKLDLEFY